MSCMVAYLDYAATAPMHPAAKAALVAAVDQIGNPGSIHTHGQHARRALERARASIAASLGAEPVETILTSGGTESDNTAIQGLWHARSRDAERPRIITTAIEHNAVLDTVAWMRDHHGAEVVIVPVDTTGVIDLDALERELDDRTALVAMLHVNNEIGTVQPVRSVAKLANAAGVPVHIDAVASYGSLPVSLHEWGVTSVAVSAHKVGGPVGIGALALRRGTKLDPLIHGGGQQYGLRSGTQNMAGAVAFGAVAELIADEQWLAEHAARVRERRDRMVEIVRQAVPDATLTGADPDALLNDSGVDVPARVPGNAHFLFPGCQGDSLVYLLDMAGVSVSTGSACHAGIPEASHAVIGCGYQNEQALGALRMTVGEQTSDDELETLAKVLPEAYERARKAGFSYREV